MNICKRIIQTKEEVKRQYGIMLDPRTNYAEHDQYYVLKFDPGQEIVYPSSASESTPSQQPIG